MAALAGLIVPVFGQLSIEGSKAAEPEDLFEKQIRPVLAIRCVTCHGPDRQDGGFRLDSRQAILNGAQAALVIPGNPGTGRLIRGIRGQLSAPDSCLLNPAEIDAFVAWVNADLPWTKGATIDPGADIGRAASVHWAFQPVQQPEVPVAENSQWVRTPIDAFVLQNLRNTKLAPSPPADRRTLIRRLCYTLTGLPPSVEAVVDFIEDPDPKAYEKLVDRLLDCPQYGEHWARHWLDVARYSDSKGYVYGREERFWAHAWAYRDWVVGSLNSDLPYDRFLLLQLAADQVDEREDGDLAAMGFLTLGRRFLGVEREIVDDRIDVVTRGTMGLTVGCARCHDHKFDPIPTADYYSLYGVFASSREKLTAVGESETGDEAFQSELEIRRQKLRTTMAKHRADSSARARARVSDYLFAQTELDKYPANGFDQVFQKSDLLPAFVYRWADYLRDAGLQDDPVFVPWHAYAELPESQFAAVKLDGKTVHPIVNRSFRVPPKSFQEVTERYGKIFEKIDAQWQTILVEADKGKIDPPAALPDPDAESLRRILYGPGAPAEVPDQPVVHSEVFFDSGSVTELWKLEGEIYRWINKSKIDVPFALTLEDAHQPVTPRVFIRGNPLKKGDDVPRQFLAVLSGENRKPFQVGSGRLEMARAIVDPSNPLTARVIVNRVWGHHFGTGMVATPSDFGLRAEAPSHPELLDWLAAKFVDEGWSLKKLHRWILLSATFRQSSKGPADDAIRSRALEIDPGNRLLWRMSPQRLTWEQFRDSMLAASGDLDFRLGGKAQKLLTEPYPKRRTLYGLVDRQYLPVLLRTFDFANPDLHIPQRSQTTVPQQALFFLNHPLVLERVRALSEFADNKAANPEERILVLFQQALQRDPTALETTEALQLIQGIGPVEADQTPVTSADWKYGYGALDEKSVRVTGFTDLPHFTGEAWQGSEKWPDAKLGWVQLTAAGGHPGNDRNHAAVRRWIAPRSMTIEIASKLVHEPAAGDGIRAFIISSRIGKLAAASIHRKTVDLNIESLQVEKGETIDLVVDIGDVLNSDQYLWNITFTEKAVGESALRWNSETDFPSNRILRLTAWEQLAQTLLCSNEFLFVD